MVRGQHQVNRLGLRLGDQLDKPQLIKVAGEQKVPAPLSRRTLGASSDSISNSLFDPAVSDPRSHIMRMDEANYSC